MEILFFLFFLAVHKDFVLLSAIVVVKWWPHFVETPSSLVVSKRLLKHMESDLKKTHSQKPTASFFFAERSSD